MDRYLETFITRKNGLHFGVHFQTLENNKDEM